MKKLAAAIGLVLSAPTLSNQFNTISNAIRSAVPAQVNGEEVLYLVEQEGAFASYTTSGSKIWRKTPAAQAMIFEINAADVDQDGNDELIAASSDGNIYVRKPNGLPLWTATTDHKVRFSEVAVVKQNGVVSVFAGGNDEYLYEFDANGNQISRTFIGGVFRKLEAGDFLQDGQPSLFIWTYSHDKNGAKFLGIVDPNSKQVLANHSSTFNQLTEFDGFMLTDLEIADVNKDGLDDIVTFGFGKQRGGGGLVAIDGQANVLAHYSVNSKHKQRYTHIQGTSLLPDQDEFVLQFGGFMYRIDLQGNLIEEKGSKYGSDGEYAQHVLNYMPLSKSVLTAGTLGGGNDVYLYDTTQANWLTTAHTLQGRSVEVKENMNTLYQQALSFNQPAYQSKSSQPWVLVAPDMNADVKALGGADVVIPIQETWAESTDRSALIAAIGPEAAKLESRQDYDQTREQMIERARAFEAAGTPFTFWAGHGNDPFYLHIETLEEILKAAPTMCYGFTYAEMHNPEDVRYQYFAENYIPRLAEAIRTYAPQAKLFFRYKNIFWGGSAHVYPWKDVFYSGKYADVLAPASEDTSSRTQDINLAGRVGMLTSGAVNDFAMRLVDDNPTSWRPLSPGGQRSISPYLRQGVMMASYGAKYGIFFDNKYTEDQGYNVFYALIKSGALPIVEPENILSIGSWMLTDNVDHHQVELIEDHHNLLDYATDHNDAIFSYATMSWAGTDLPDHDYSKLALGVPYRWTNYVPELPNGMVPIMTSEYASTLETNGVPYVVTDLKYGIDNGAKVSAANFKATFEQSLNAGKNAMPVTVEGAAWSAIRIDDNHIRVILMDQGYLDPQVRNASIKMTGVTATEVKDILADQVLAGSATEVNLQVPAGSLRIVDITTVETISPRPVGNLNYDSGDDSDGSDGSDTDPDTGSGGAGGDSPFLDTDGDGMADEEDAFPNDPSEQLDTDGDGIGNNSDPDDDNDGRKDKNDAFPLDPTEKFDTDGDGIGNNTDKDDDGDGVNDKDDAFKLDPTEWLDTDGDGIGNNADTDDDNDGIEDSLDLDPLDPTVGLNLDLDGDGVNNDQDAFPNDPTETHDFDGDGIGDNADEDDDNDGRRDDKDAFPFDPTEKFDNDGDGIGNNADDDDDNDGVLDRFDDYKFDPTLGKKGDFDWDLDVDIQDFVRFNHLMRDPSQFRPEYDFNGDGVVNRHDTRALMALCTNTGCRR